VEFVYTNNGDSFTLSTTTIDNIAVGETSTFTVVPKTGLAAGTYTTTVTVTRGIYISTTFRVSFTVNQSIYSIGSDVTGTYTFPAAVPGYGTQAVKTVTVTNTGNRATNAALITLSGTNSGSFSLSKPAISDLEVGETDTFWVRPKIGLAAGTYTAIVSVSNNGGSHSYSANFTVSFTVNPSTYGINLDITGTHTFPGATAGYGAQTAKSVTITNTGNHATGALTIVLSGTDSESFTLSRTAIGITAGGTSTFTVVPKIGLAAGTYTATVTVNGGNGITANFNVSFTVNLVTINLDTIGTHTFSEVTPGYGEQAAKSVTITNTGNQATGALTIALSGTNSSSFILSTTTITSFSTGLTRTFTVRPKIGLDVGTYTATVTVTGGNSITANFIVSFTVIVPAGPLTVTFDPYDASSGSAPSAQTVAAYGTYITLPDKGNMRWRYRLIGSSGEKWYTAPFEGWIEWPYYYTNPRIVYPAGTSYKVKNNITLYAVWGLSVLDE
jgi:uncharacterized membrane protein